MQIDRQQSENAFTGLEAAIVLIAFVVVAAVFSYVVLGAGFYTTQKSQESVYKSTEQVTTNVLILGNIYLVNSTGAGTEGDFLKFSIGLAPGSPSVDLSKMTVVYSSEMTGPSVYTLTTGAADTSHFSATKTGTPVTEMEQQDQIAIEMYLMTALTKNQEFRLEVRPPVGSPLAMSRTTPPYMYVVNVL
jgi:flagellin FlaB